MITANYAILQKNMLLLMAVIVFLQAILVAVNQIGLTKIAFYAPLPCKKLLRMGKVV